jgi:hypothetical protein
MRFFRCRQPKLLDLAPHYQFNRRAFTTIPLTPSPNSAATKTVSETVDCCVFVPLSSWHRPNWNSHIHCLFASPSHRNSPPFSRRPSMMARICCCGGGGIAWEVNLGGGRKMEKIGVGGDGSNRWLIMVSVLHRPQTPYIFNNQPGITTVETE